MSAHRPDSAAGQVMLFQRSDQSPENLVDDDPPLYFYVFILASKPKGALYVGLTSELLNSVLQHKCNEVPGITAQYAINRLVYFERFKQRDAAGLRENILKEMHRSWKLNLITQHNFDWRDLYQDLAQ